MPRITATSNSTLAILALGLLSFVLGALSSSAILDDGFIYLVVTKNIVAGEGWRFNSDGPRVNPCTSPLYTLLLIALQLTNLSPIVASLVLYSLGTWGASAGLYLLYRQRSTLVATVLSLSYTVHQMFFLSLGLETSLFIAAVVWTALLWQRERYYASSIGASLASLLRIDGLLLVGTLVFFAVLSRSKIRVVKILSFTAVPVAAWFCFSYFFFGHFLPQSVLVKSVQSGFGIWKREGPWIYGLVTAPAFPLVTWTLVGFALYVTKGRTPPAQRILYLFCASQIALYSIAGAPARYLWYLAPACLMVDLILAEAFMLFQQQGFSIGRYHFKPQQSDRFATFFHGMLLFALLKVCSVLPVVVPLTYRYAPEYKEVAAWINRNSTSISDRVAAVEIGYLGYYLDSKVLDIHGLIHPEALPSLKRGDLTWWYREPYPEFVLLHWPGEWDGEPSLRWPFSQYEDFHSRYAERYTTQSGLVKVFSPRGKTESLKSAEPHK